MLSIYERETGRKWPEWVFELKTKKLAVFIFLVFYYLRTFKK